MYSIPQLKRLKNNVPFSSRLNEFIEVMLLGHIANGYITQLEYTDSDPYPDFKAMCDDFTKLRRLKIWKGASEATIFGPPENNWLFRAWHDLSHIELGLDFSPMNELQVAFYQAAQLPKDWMFERNLILIEVAGQIAYNAVFNDSFPHNQRLFTIEMLEGGKFTEQSKLY